MSVVFREACRGDVPEIMALLADDVLGQNREVADPEAYLAAFEAMAAEPGNHLIVGVAGGRIVATYQITFISGLSLQAARRAQVEAVRVARELRGEGIGAHLIADIEARARAAGCALVQLNTNKTRDRALAFYQAHGFVASHVGFKKALD